MARLQAEERVLGELILIPTPETPEDEDFAENQAPARHLELMRDLRMPTLPNLLATRRAIRHRAGAPDRTVSLAAGAAHLQPAARACWHCSQAIQPNARPEARYYGSRQAAPRARLTLADTRSGQRHVARHLTAPRAREPAIHGPAASSKPVLEAAASAIEPIAGRAAPCLAGGTPTRSRTQYPHPVDPAAPCITAAPLPRCREA
jgi:hypothetical protein